MKQITETHTHNSQKQKKQSQKQQQNNNNNSNNLEHSLEKCDDRAPLAINLPHEQINQKQIDKSI